MKDIVLLGININDYPNTDSYEKDIYEFSFSEGLKEHNMGALKNRLGPKSKYNFHNEAALFFVNKGNVINSTKEIIAHVRVAITLDLLTDEQWDKAIPIIEEGLLANKDYVKMLDEIAPILEKYFEKWKQFDMNYTLQQRIKLELWQGRFNVNHWCNPEKKPNFS